MKVSKVTKEHFIGKVYNLGTTPTHNYFANKILVHNCYQASGRKGKHADFEHIKRLIDEMAKAEVFELVLGGGEPTSHPQFGEILEYADSKGLSVSFTTYDTSWEKDKKLLNQVHRHCSGFAISCLEISELEKLNVMNHNQKKAYRVDGIPRWANGKVHIPLGCYDEETLRRALNFARKNYMDFTILGFKSTGRGADFKPYDYKFIIDYLKNENVYEFGADSVFVKEFEKELMEAGVSARLITSSEGSLSCYVDAVNQRMAPSSYAPDSEYHSYMAGDNINLWKKFPYIKGTPSPTMPDLRQWTSDLSDYSLAGAGKMLDVEPYKVMPVVNAIIESNGKFLSIYHHPSLEALAKALALCLKIFAKNDIFGKTERDMIDEARKITEVELFKVAIATNKKR